MKPILTKLTNHQTLSKAEAKEAFILLGSGVVNPSQMAAFVTVFLMRSITTEELAGFREAMLSLCVAVNLDKYSPVDLVGTGGDSKNTFNISTLSSIVAAGAGVKIAKHGNYAVSSSSGSSNVLETIGFKFSNDAAHLEAQIDQSNITFFHAPLFHPAMKNMAPVRKELGMKTFFNVLGPLTNPAHLQKRSVGVYNLEIMRLYHSLLEQTSERYLIVHSLDGYDEISLTGQFKLISNEFSKVYEPADLGLPKLHPDELFGGNTVEEAAAVFMKILSGEGNSSQNAVVAANAGTAIWVDNPGIDLKEAIHLAKKSLESGKALETFNKLLSI